MKSIASVLQKLSSPSSLDVKDQIQVLSSDESTFLSGGDKEYKPSYDEVDAVENPDSISSSIANFFSSLF